MLVLGRKVGDEILIGANIRLVIVAIRGNQVRLGFDAPREVPVRRREIEGRHLMAVGSESGDALAGELVGCEEVGTT